MNKIYPLLTTVRVLSDSGLRCWSQQWMIKAKVVRDEVKKWIVILFPLQPVLIAVLNSASVQIIQTIFFIIYFQPLLKGKILFLELCYYWEIQDSVQDFFLFITFKIFLFLQSNHICLLRWKAQTRFRRSLLKRIHFYIRFFPPLIYTIVGLTECVLLYTYTQSTVLHSLICELITFVEPQWVSSM